MTVIDFRHTAPTRAASSLWRARIPPCPYSPDTAPHGAKQGAKRWRVNGRGKKSALSLYCVLASDMRQGATPVISSSVDRGHRLRSKWVRASARIAGHPAAPSLTKSDRLSACPACPACLPCLLALPAGLVALLSAGILSRHSDVIPQRAKQQWLSFMRPS